MVIYQQLPTHHLPPLYLEASAWHPSKENWRSFDHQPLLAREQKGCCGNTRETRDQLLIDKMVMRDSWSRKINLGMCSIDYKKAFDSVPHTWIIEYLKLYKVSNTIVSFTECSMKNWITKLTIKGTNLGQVTNQEWYLPRWCNYYRYFSTRQWIS